MKTLVMHEIHKTEYIGTYSKLIVKPFVLQQILITTPNTKPLAIIIIFICITSTSILQVIIYQVMSPLRSRFFTIKLVLTFEQVIKEAKLITSITMPNSDH